LYAAGAALRDVRIGQGWETVRRLQWPVISVGNLSAGGAGKTPFTIALAQLLKHQGFHVDVLSRGYGRTGDEPMRVRTEGTAREFGDEPLLIARQTGVPVYVAPRRHDAGLLAEKESGRQDWGPAVHILDDGFQHRQLARDVDIVLLSEADLRDSLLPAGNLREPVRALRRAAVIALPVNEPSLAEKVRRFGWEGIVWRVSRCTKVPQIDGPVAAFCGIARPGQFFAELEVAGMRMAWKRAFKDHHPYTAEDMRELVKTGRQAGAKAFVTTEKDALRLGELAKSLPPEIPLVTAPLRVEIQDAEAVAAWVSKQIANSSAQKAL
jgi:tetraacyldisaccharide 4'-kinase